MKIAVVDVAAENSGALSVLYDFYNYVKNYDNSNRYYFFTSVIRLEETENITCINNEKIKKSWFHRYCWEYRVFPKYVKQEKFDVLFSLQNNAMPIKKIKQVVYFHNSLHLLDKNKFKLQDPNDRKFWIYTRIVTPIVLKSLRRADCLICQTMCTRDKLKEYTAGKVLAIYPDATVEIKNNRGKIKGFLYPAGPLSYKHMEYIVDAEKRLKVEERHEILFTFKGDENEYATRVFNEAKGLDKIRFIGWQNRDDILNLYNEYGLVFTSTIESFPIPFIEAMAYGVPIVAADEEFSREILKNYKNGILCKPENLEIALKEAEKMSIMSGKRIVDRQNSTWADVLEELKHTAIT